MVAVAWAMPRHAAIRVALPTIGALAGWVAFMAAVDWDALVTAVSRYISPEGFDPGEPRLYVTRIEWARTILSTVGPLLLVGIVAMAVIRRHIGLAVVPLGYVAVALAASSVYPIKEARFILAVVPMAAISIALLFRGVGQQR